MTTHISFAQDRPLVQSSAAAEDGSQELTDVLQRIIQNASALLGVRSCSVALLDASGTTLVTLAALLRHGHKPRHTRFRLNEGVAGWVAEHREAVMINNVNLDPRFKRLGRVRVGSIMCAPLIYNGTFVGTLTVSSEETNAFDDKQMRMLTVFAEQAVLAVIYARHAELAQRQANQLELLLHLSQGITTRLDSETLYRTILSNMLRLVPCDLAIIYLYQDKPQELYAVAEWTHDDIAATEEPDDAIVSVKTTNLQREKISLYDANSTTAWAAAHRHPVLRTPTQSMPDGDDASTSTVPIVTNAELAAPFVSKDILYGVLALSRKEPFTSDELRCVRNLSNVAAAAVENVQLFNKVRTDQEQLRAILASSSDGIALLNANACFVEANTAFGQLFGIEPQQIIGMECIELFGGDEECEETCHCDLCMIRKAIVSEQTLPYRELDVHIQDTVRSLGLSITPVPTMSSPLSLLVARDVTAIRDVTRMKANFLSMITHELRSPLNSINGYLDLTLTGVGGELNAQQREFVLRARAGSEHLYALLEDLLLVSRADSGQLRLNREIISLQEVIANAVEELELSAADHGITITVDIAREFPRLYADTVRIQQVLRNLLSNAIRFTPAGGQVTVSAQVEGEQEAGQDPLFMDEQPRVVQLRIKDTGSGIAPEYQERIFERFFQVPGGSAGRTGGQGLGLAIVKMIVELHGGYVSIESEPGQGSTFTCTLPCLLL